VTQDTKDELTEAQRDLERMKDELHGVKQEETQVEKGVIMFCEATATRTRSVRLPGNKR